MIQRRPMEGDENTKQAFGLLNRIGEGLPKKVFLKLKSEE